MILALTVTGAALVLASSPFARAPTPHRAPSAVAVGLVAWLVALFLFAHELRDLATRGGVPPVALASAIAAATLVVLTTFLLLASRAPEKSTRLATSLCAAGFSVAAIFAVLTLCDELRDLALSSVAAAERSIDPS